MENNQVEKSQAELYREERKKRMASVAKKNAKKNPKSEKAKQIVGKVISIVLAVVLALGVIYGSLNFFGVPQKVLTAAKIGDTKISVAKYNFYYMDMYLSVANTSKQYDSQYGTGYGAMYTGYDSSKTPMEQEYTLGEIEGFEGEDPTWADYLRSYTLKYLQTYIAYSELAREAGMTLTEDEAKEIDEQVESLRKTATENDFSLDRYLIKLYGKGVDEKLLREVMEERQLAAKYSEQKQTETNDAITEEQISTEYDENLADYAVLTVYGFTVAADTSSVSADATDEEKASATAEAMAKAKEKADAYAANIKDVASLTAQAKENSSSATEDSVKFSDVTASSLKNTFGQAAADWALSAERAVGNVTVVESSKGYSVLYMSVLPHKNTVKPVDVRHILVQFPTSSSGQATTISDEAKAEYREKAQSLYDQYLANPTEDNFAALATANSADGGSKDNGGLYENVKVGDMVQQFNDWCFDPARKPGDTGIIETTYGYHVMYYVGNEHEETWKTTIKTALANESLTAFNEDIENGDTYKVSESKTAIKWSASQLESFIAQQYINR